MSRQSVTSWLGILAAIGIVLGGITGLLWARLVRLPTYRIDDAFHADMASLAQAQVFTADAWFVVLGVVAGAAMGVVSWSWFRLLGWPVVLIAAASGLLPGLVCWGLGALFGPGPLAGRLATAAPGSEVPISLQLHAPVALAFWAFAAVVPVLVASLFVRPEPVASVPGARGRRRPVVEPPEHPGDPGLAFDENAAVVRD